RDFRARYGYAPYLVETFVSPDQKGTCFKAANFRSIGQTKGRGRHATTHACTLSKKKVLIYELDPRWRAKLGVPHVELHPRLEVGKGLNADQWTQQEFAEAELGNRQRSRRLVLIVNLLSTLMGRPVTAAPKRDPRGMAAYYGFLERADKYGITPAKVLAPHRGRTVERMRTQKTVLCLQDGTDISYSTRPECEGLEVIGRNQTTCEAKGVHLHATLAINDEGLPLGVLRCAYRKKEGQTKTDRWIDGLLDIDEAAQTLPRKTRVLSVMDREADAYAIFAAQKRCKRTDILVRANHDRSLKGKDEQRLFKAMRKGPAAGHMSVSRLSHRAKSGRVTSEARIASDVQLEVRYQKVTLPPTNDKAAEPVRVWAIHVREVAPPPNAEAIEWYLLTTAEVSSLAKAEEIIEFFCLRWRLEDIFRMLKTGCKVEELPMQQAGQLHLVITLYMVTAWRIMLMALLGRIQSGLPADLIFTETELDMLRVYARNYNEPEHTDLASAVLLMAMMGGYRNQKHDPPPGYEIIWKGYTALQMRAITIEEWASCDLVQRPS
ncbi:MAG: IS4 family transposase, partial [Bacteroidota bacterium]|nr:IS4 family transposase [Bacteroidota bacterium]